MVAAEILNELQCGRTAKRDDRNLVLGCELRPFRGRLNEPLGPVDHVIHRIGVVNRDLHDVGVVQESIERSAGEQLIPKQRRPLGERAVAGDDGDLGLKVLADVGEWERVRKWLEAVPPHVQVTARLSRCRAALLRANGSPA